MYEEVNKIISIKKSKGKLGVNIEHSKYDKQILTTRNGWQWSGMPINDDLADLLIDVLIEYKKQRLQEKEDNG